MAVRAPKNAISRYQAAEAGSTLSTEIAAEKAAALGRSAQRMRDALKAYRDAGDAEDTEEARDRAAEAVYGFLIQRELRGLRDREAVIRDYSIPSEILARLGATAKRL